MVTTDDTELTTDSPEYAAYRRRFAVAEYNSTPPHIRTGLIPEEKLLEWQEVLHEPQNPEELWASAWVDAELGFRHLFVIGEQFSDKEERRAAIYTMLRRAEGKFEQVEKHPSIQVTALQRSQAAVAGGSMLVWSALVAPGGDNPVLAAINRYDDKQGAAVDYLLDYVQNNHSVEAAMWANALTVTSVVSAGSGLVVALPCPPRLASPHLDTHERQSAVLLSFAEMNVFYIRVGSQGSSSSIHIPYEMLANEDYPLHRFGTLFTVKQLTEQRDLTTIARMAELEEQRKKLLAISSGELAKQVVAGHINAEIGRLAQQQDGSGKLRRAADHHEKVRTAILGHLDAEVARIKQTGHDTHEPDDPFEWLDSLHPSRNPYFVNKERTDAAISALELRVAEETISAEDALRLGWLYIDVAAARALDPAVPTVQVKGDGDRAEEIFSIALEKTDPQDTLQFCEASLANGAAWMQRIVLGNEELRPDDIHYYRQMLMYTGERATKRYAELPPGSEEAAALEHFMQRVTLCLLTTQEGDGIVAVTTPPRQQNKDGWDVTVWSQSLHGFTPGQYGRLRITNKEDVSSLADGIVTVTRQQLGQEIKPGKRPKNVPAFPVFEALREAHHDVWNRPHQVKERNRRIEKAWKAVEARIAATEI